jgi:hypothetical protein
MNMADSVQWALCFPEVTILVLSGVLALANKFVGEIKGHFTLEEGERRNGQGICTSLGRNRPSQNNLDDGTAFVFQALFAEHCIPNDDGKASEFQTPAVSTDRKSRQYSRRLLNSR